MRITIRPVSVRVRCDIYGCRNRAAWIVGSVSHKSLGTRYCTDCLKEIATESKKALEKMPDADKMPAENPKVLENDSTMPADDTDDSTEKTKVETNEVENIVSEAVNNTDKAKDENVSEDPISQTSDRASFDTYVCKHCGVTFPRPEGLSEYRKHIVRCANK